MRRGITLVELLMSIVIVTIVTMGSTRAFESALTVDSHLRSSRDAVAVRRKFEDTIINLIHHAWLSSGTSNQKSYFIGAAPSVINTTGASSASGSSSGTSSVSASAGGVSTGGGTGSYGTPNIITFTASNLGIPGALMASNNDFETNNQNFGPAGGITEVELSETAVGSGGEGKTGMFLRLQTPADADATQGGTEQLISADVSQIGFEFFNGQSWVDTWDNREQTPAPGHLPAAVRVTYRFTGDSTDTVFVVRIPASDVTYMNPVTVTGG